MADDHLTAETAVSVAVSEKGIEAKAKSRTIAAIDRLCGNVFDFLNAPLERRVTLTRAKIDGDKQMIESLARYGVERLQKDEELAKRAAEKHFKEIFREQENTEAVVREAVEILKVSPPSPQESASGPDQLEFNFVRRLQEYAKQADADDLRHRWARVLASEIKKPGTFSGKAMRVVDELDVETAKLFEEVCHSRVGGVVPRRLIKKFEDHHALSLELAGLATEGIIGRLLKTAKATNPQGERRLLAFFAQHVLDFDANSRRVDPEGRGHSKLLWSDRDVIHIPIVQLTPEGHAIAGILPDEQEVAVQRFIAAAEPLLGSTIRVHAPVDVFGVWDIELPKSD